MNRSEECLEKGIKRLILGDGRCLWGRTSALIQDSPKKKVVHKCQVTMMPKLRKVWMQKPCGGKGPGYGRNGIQLLLRFRGRTWAQTEVIESQFRGALSSGIQSQCKGLLLGHINQESGRITFFHCEGSGGGPAGRSGGLFRVVEGNSVKTDRFWMHLEVEQVGHIKSGMEHNIENKPWGFVR